MVTDEKKVKFTQFGKSQRAPGKISILLKFLRC